MSQHIYRTTGINGQELEVQAGWDKAMQWFYCVVSLVESDGTLGEDVYSNLDENQPEKLSLGYFLNLLKKQ